MVSARQILAEAERRGAHFSIVGERLEATPASAFDPILKETIATHKAEILAELRRRSSNSSLRKLGRRGQVCNYCLRIEQCYSLDDGSLDCPTCAEWHVTCPTFIVAKCAAEMGEKVACISCGSSWELHGQPCRDQWRIVDDIESVALIEARFVVAKASAMIAMQNS